MKLTVSFLIIAMMLPPIIGMISDLSDEAESRNLSEQAWKLEDAVVRTYYDGDGCFRTVDIDLRSGEMLMIGGEGPEGYLITMYKEGEKMGDVLIDSPPVRIIGPRTALHGQSAVVVRSVSVDGMQCAEVVPA